MIASAAHAHTGAPAHASRLRPACIQGVRVCVCVCMGCKGIAHRAQSCTYASPMSTYTTAGSAGSAATSARHTRATVSQTSGLRTASGSCVVHGRRACEVGCGVWGEPRRHSFCLSPTCAQRIPRRKHMHAQTRTSGSGASPLGPPTAWTAAHARAMSTTVPNTVAGHAHPAPHDPPHAAGRHLAATFPASSQCAPVSRAASIWTRWTV